MEEQAGDAVEPVSGSVTEDEAARGVSLWFCQPLDSSNRAMLTPAPEGPSPLNVGPR